MLSSSNSSPSCPGRLDSQRFHRIFPAALLRRQHNILYATILHQPSLVIELEHQSSYEEDDAVQSLVRVFHHLCSTQIYLGSFEPHTDHVVSTTLHITAALDDIMDLLHDHNFHQYVVALPPNNLTLARVFHPIYGTMTAVKRDEYEKSDLRLVNRLSSPPHLPVPPPCAPSPTESTPALSPLSTTTTLIDEPADTCPAFHQNHTASYPTHVVPRDPHLGPEPTASSTDCCFQCHAAGHFHVDCLEYECPNSRQHTPGHPQYRCHCHYCSFCRRFGHTPHYCPDRQCTLCSDPGHIIADCPFSEDPSSRVIFNNGDPEGL